MVVVLVEIARAATPAVAAGAMFRANGWAANIGSGVYRKPGTALKGPARRHCTTKKGGPEAALCLTMTGGQRAIDVSTLTLGRLAVLEAGA